jgi:hypothetical protein
MRANAFGLVVIFGSASLGVSIPRSKLSTANPIACGLIVTIVVDPVIPYPIQTASNLLAYETGYYTATDVRRLGLGMLLLVVIVILLTIPYWSVLSLPLNLMNGFELFCAASIVQKDFCNKICTKRRYI